MSDEARIILIALTAIFSGTVLVASVKALIFFGAMTKSVEDMKTALLAGEQKLERFTAQLQQTLDDHEGRILTIEAERRMEARFGRRTTDPIMQVAQQLAATDKELHDAR